MHEVGRRAALEGLAVTAAEVSRRPQAWRHWGYLRLGELGTDAMAVAAEAQRLRSGDAEPPELVTVRLAARQYTSADLRAALDELGALASAGSERWGEDEHLAAVHEAARVASFAAFRLRDRGFWHPRVLAWGAAAALVVVLVWVV